MSIQRILLAFLLIVVYNIALSQTRKDRGGSAESKIQIQGQVVDAATGNALEFATITIFNLRDKSVVSGGITDVNGNFNFACTDGKLSALVEFISYQEYEIVEIPIDRTLKSANLGKLELMPNAEMLDEVEVRAEKSTMQFSLDKKIFNVGKDLSQNGGTALDILDNVPSVTVDIEGGVELRGSANVRILIDGKPSGLVGVGNTDGLKSIPSNLIEKVELITNPSAKYEAEGMAGIINIVLKKNQSKGFNGSVDASLGYPTVLGAAANLNYRKDRLNFFVNYGLQYQENPGGGFRDQDFTNSNGDLELLRQDREQNRIGLSNNMKFGADYYFTEKSILTTAFQFKTASEDNFSTLTNDDYLGSLENILMRTVRTDDEEENEDKLEYSLSYRKKYKKRGHEFTADFRYQDNTEDEGSALTNKFYPDKTTLIIDSVGFQRSANVEGERMYILQTDYVKPFSDEGKVELGFRASMRQIKNDYRVEDLDQDRDLWISNLSFTNNFVYDENIVAAYLIYGNKISKFSYQVGFRGEYTDVKTELKTSGETNPRDYFNLFPSAHIGYELSEGNSMQISYSRRVRRPRFWDLNPFFTFNDDRNFFSGNPDLDPEFTDSYEIGHLKIWEKASLNSSVYYRHGTDIIQRVLSVDSLGRTSRRPENLNSSDDFGLEFSGNYKASNKFQINGSANFFRAITEDAEYNKVDNYSWSTRLSSKFALVQKVDAQVSLNYRAPRDSPQGRRLAITSIDLGFSKDIFKKNGTLNLSVRDLLNTRKRRGITDIDNYYSEAEFQWRLRQVILSLNYRINQKKKRNRGGRSLNSDNGGF